MDYSQIKPSRNFSDFLELVAILRKECPWDRKQTHHSIKENLVEEAYEAVEASKMRIMRNFQKNWATCCCTLSFTAKWRMRKSFRHRRCDLQNFRKIDPPSSHTFFLIRC